MNFVIENPYHFKYLEVQCGDIAHLVHDFSMWKNAYEERIERVYKSMLPALPEHATSMLDIGGGLSGIGARLNKHYGGRLHVCVLDGKNTLAVVNKHSEPFNNATVTQHFLKQNGVRSQDFYEPGERIPEKAFDIIVSTQAWCFHIPPETYFEQVKQALKENGTLIVDVRKSHPEWRSDLYNFFGMETLLATAPKWDRLAYEVLYAD